MPLASSFDVSARARLSRTYDRLAFGMLLFVLLATLVVGGAAAYVEYAGQPLLIRLAGPIGLTGFAILGYLLLLRVLPPTERARRIEVAERSVTIEYADRRTRVWRWFDPGAELRVQDFAVAQDGTRRWSDIDSHLFQAEFRNGKESHVMMISWPAAHALIEMGRSLNLPERETREEGGAEGGGWFVQNRFGRGVTPQRLQPSPAPLWR